jgi:hypothetical protein
MKRKPEHHPPRQLARRSPFKITKPIVSYSNIVMESSTLLKDATTPKVHKSFTIKSKKINKFQGGIGEEEQW